MPLDTTFPSPMTARIRRDPFTTAARRIVVAAAAAVALATGGAPSPASATAAARPSCDRLGGTTLAANRQVRLFRVRMTRAEIKREGYERSYVQGVRFRACAYRTRHVTLLRESVEYGQNAEPTTFTWAINGPYAAVSTSEAGSDDGTDRSAGTSTESLGHLERPHQQDDQTQ